MIATVMTKMTSIRGNPKILANLHEQEKEDTQTVIPVFVSPQFHDVIRGNNVYFISYGKPNTTFYLKATNQKSALTYFRTKKVIGNDNDISK